MSAAIIKTIRAQLGALHAAGYEGIVASSVGDLDVLIAEIDRLTAEHERLTAPPTDGERRERIHSAVRAMQDDGVTNDEREAPNPMLGEARVAADELRNAAVEPWEIEACDKIREFLDSGVRRQGPPTDDDLGRMAQRFYEVASRSGEITFVTMAAKPAIVEALRAALAVRS